MINSLVSFDHPITELLKVLPLGTAQQINNLVGDFERRRLKIDLARSQDEPEVDVDEGAIDHIQQNIPVVPVFDPEHVAY